MLNRTTPRFALLLLCLIVFAVPSPAQTRSANDAAPPTPAASPTPSSATAAATDDNADLSITANVTARELKFEVVPNPKVEFTGQPKRETVWDAARTNLPPAVQPGVTYRDIGIRLKITSVFADIERIVAEALGEIPVSDNATTPTNAADVTNASTANNADARTPTTTPDAPHAADATQSDLATTRTPPTSPSSSTRPQTPARSSSRRQVRRP